MHNIKQTVLWLLLVLAFTPLAFILMPIIVIAAILGALDTVNFGLHHRTEANS